MKCASIFTVLISSLALAIGVYGEKDITAPPPPVITNANAENDIAAAVNASMVINEHYHELRNLPKEFVVPPPRRLKGSSITTVTITFPKDEPYTYYGMPSTLKVGTYQFKFVNKSAVYHSFRIHGGDGWYATSLCAYCTRYLTLQVKIYYNIDTGEWEPWAMYYFYPASTTMNYVSITS